MTRKDLHSWLTLAYRDVDDCPPPEIWLEKELASLSSHRRRELESHADGCARCAAERRLAQSFDREEMDLSRDEVRGLMAALDQSSPERIVEFSRPRPARGPRWPVRLALAATLVLAAGLVFQVTRTRPPRLPDRPVEDVVRSTRVELVAPLDEVASIPSELNWTGVDDVDQYRIVIRAVDQSILWEETTSQSSAEIPVEVRNLLRPGVTYLWVVEALGSEGAVVGRSETRSFTVSPGANE